MGFLLDTEFGRGDWGLVGWTAVIAAPVSIERIDTA